jgi:hypothetical protein
VTIDPTKTCLRSLGTNILPDNTGINSFLSKSIDTLEELFLTALNLLGMRDSLIRHFLPSLEMLSLDCFEHKSCSLQMMRVSDHLKERSRYGYDVVVRDRDGRTPPGWDHRVQEECVTRFRNRDIPLRVDGC